MKHLKLQRIFFVLSALFIFNVACTKENNGITDTDELGLNLGTGMRYQLSDKIYLNPELKYTVGNASYLSISVGLLYNF